MSEAQQRAAKKNNSNNYKKRAPTKPLFRQSDIFITNKSDFRAQLKKCETILNSEVGECYLHAIGNAINRAINLALKLQEEFSYKFETNTSTIQLVDDHHPLNDDDDFSIRKRINSCIHIRMYRPYMIQQQRVTTNEVEKLIKI